MPDSDRRRTQREVCAPPRRTEGQGRWVGGANPDAHRHACKPPMRHVGCCDGTGGTTITEAHTRGLHGYPPSMVGARTICISGRPDGEQGATWLCNCGQGWKVGRACDRCHFYGSDSHAYGGIHTVGLAWRPMSRFASWRLRKAAK